MIWCGSVVVSISDALMAHVALIHYHSDKCDFISAVSYQCHWCLNVLWNVSRIKKWWPIHHFVQFGQILHRSWIEQLARKTQHHVAWSHSSLLSKPLPTDGAHYHRMACLEPMVPQVAPAQCFRNQRQRLHTFYTTWNRVRLRPTAFVLPVACVNKHFEPGEYEFKTCIDKVQVSFLNVWITPLDFGLFDRWVMGLIDGSMSLSSPRYNFTQCSE